MKKQITINTTVNIPTTIELDDRQSKKIAKEWVSRMICEKLNIPIENGYWYYIDYEKNAIIKAEEQSGFSHVWTSNNVLRETTPEDVFWFKTFEKMFSKNSIDFLE